MTTIEPNQILMTAWKQQLDTGLRMVEALVEGATRMHEVQLEAAMQTGSGLAKCAQFRGAEPR